MAIECAAIASIMLVLFVLFLCRHNKVWAWAVLPLALVPASDFVMEFLLVHVLKVKVSVLVGIIVLVAAVAVSCVWLGLVSNGIKRSKTRVTYIVIANSFNVLLAAILVSNILQGIASSQAFDPL